MIEEKPSLSIKARIVTSLRNCLRGNKVNPNQDFNGVGEIQRINVENFYGNETVEKTPAQKRRFSCDWSEYVETGCIDGDPVAFHEDDPEGLRHPKNRTLQINL